MPGDAVTGLLSQGNERVASRFTRPEPHRAFWIALWTVAAAAEFGALAPVLFRHVAFEPVDVVFRLVGGSFAACGLIAWHRRPDNHSGRLMTATGFAFFVSPLLGQLDTPLTRTAALWLPDLWILFFVPLVLTLLTGGRLRTGADRALVGTILVALLVLAPLWLMFSPEEDNLLRIVGEGRLAGVVDTVQRAVFVAVPVATAVVLATRWRTASAPGRRALLPGVAGAVCLLLFALLLVVHLVTGERSQLLLWIAACSIATVPLAFLVGLLRSRLARGGLADLFRGLRTMRPDELQPALARALGDPGLLVAYPLPDHRGHVDGDGVPVTLPAPGGDRSVAVVERDGEQVASLVYDRSLDDDPELVEAIGGAAAIALENAQLHAEAQARLVELRASRERIITAADAERRRIERNLHDGAQQRLVTLALQLSLIGRQIRHDPSDAEQLVTSAAEELARSLEELRELARGIHPAALDQGLEYALDALVLRSAVPTTLIVEPGGRLPEHVEFAAYFVASEALANVAKHAHASAATVRVVRTGPDAVVEITDDGVGGADPTLGSGLRGLTDRVEALGGRLRLSGSADGGTVVTAVLPQRRRARTH
ncbi:sensor histidine kinase [Pseudonocardia broussonetiae]|uniref:histidine kinase n=1 Tax=Pseudonocardia broussonetiae TaxID=2736640 RepID=A0A6M6JHC1_9PSEU|nr:sensor histidine kinase [Pseudonocardia broussonetiae]QJY47428.1 sensor histidine kinase [Pseudonocardia broussonetiae]